MITAGTTNYPAAVREYFKDRGIKVTVAKAADVRYLDAKQTKAAVGWPMDEDGKKLESDGLSFTGSNRVRYLRAGLTGRQRYRQPEGSAPLFYLPDVAPSPRRRWSKLRKNPREKIYITEGEAKALCLTAHDRPMIGLGGVWSWKANGQPLECFAMFDWRDRVVVLIFDSDVVDKQQVQQALIELAQHLTSLGAKVFVKIIPATGDGKTGVDDFIVAHGLPAFDALEEIPITDPQFADWGAHEATRELNRSHAFVMLDGKATILTEADDPDYRGTRKIALSRPRDVRDQYANQLVEYGPPDANGNRKLTTKFDIWFRDPARREIRRVWFQPGTPWGVDPATRDFNLWQGWAVDPQEPDARHRWDRLKGHVEEVVANGDVLAASYLLDWMAFGIQHPEQVPGVAVVTIGGEGTGKGILWSSYGKLYGRHYMHLVQKSQLVGQFNDHHKDKLLIHADESFYAGDHQAASALKTMITEKTMMVEAKFVTPYPLPSYRKLVISSNESWVVPAGSDARRYAVLEVSERRKGDLIYFRKIVDELEQGGYQAMLFDLLHRDLTRFDPRRLPQTTGLLNQKKLSFDPVTEWWFEKLVAGTLSDKSNGAWEGKVLASTVQQEIEARLTSRFDKQRAIETRTGIKLQQLCPTMRKVRGTSSHILGHSKARASFYEFPSLETCRRDFERYTHTPIDWATGDLKREDT